MVNVSAISVPLQGAMHDHDDDDDRNGEVFFGDPFYCLGNVIGIQGWHQEQGRMMQHTDMENMKVSR